MRLQSRLAVIFLLVAALLLAACAAPAAPTPAAAVATLTVPAAPVPTLTSVPAATSQAPALTAATPAPTQDAEATAYWAQATAIVTYVVATEQPRLLASYPSPDGQWVVTIVTYACVQAAPGAGQNALDQLIAQRQSDGTERALAGQLQNCGGLGAYGLGGLFWSRNSRFFYYTDARQGVPDGQCAYWARPIWRADVAAQRVEAVGGAQASPDQTRLATWQDGALVIWDADTGEIARLRPGNAQAFPGPIAWSPDSRALVTLQTAVACPPSGHSSLTRVDLPALAQTTLLETDSPTFVGLSWDAPTRLTLIDELSHLWLYNLTTHTLERQGG